MTEPTNPETRLPSGVVTFVLTDIVGSTRLWEIDPEAMASALEAHGEIIESAVSAGGGVLLKSRGEGDSTFSVFAQATEAVRAAHRMQLDLSGAAWATADPVRVRIAVHAGEATETGGDYVGTAVNRAARLRGIAEGGEVVLSAAAAALSGDDLPIDVTLRSLGSVRLRDLSRDEEAFVLAGGGLPDVADGPRGQVAPDLLAERGVTPRERDVFDAIAERLTNLEIAERLTVSERTVESHVSSLLRKLDASNRIELAELAKRVRADAPSGLPPMLLVATRRSECFGRDAERATLLEAWRRAAAGEAGLVVVAGEAGVGKSRLAADLATQVHERGGRVLLGAATDGAGLAYQPFAEALEPVVEAATEPQLRSDLGRHAADLARVLPVVGTRLAVAPSVTGDDPIGERHRLHAAIQAYLVAVARRQPTLLVLEDVHWAAPLARETLLSIARTAGDAPLLVVATTRDSAPDLDASLTSWLAEAQRLPVCELVALDGIDVAATEQLMADLGSDVDVAAAHHATGGNPLFLREMAGSEGRSVTLADFMADRYERLHEEDLVVVDTAAIVGESFAVDLVARAVDRPVGEVMEALERAEAAGLVQQLAAAPPRFAFVHALFRHTRVEGLGAGRRMRLHRSVAEALRPRADDPAVLGEAARHACIAAPLGDADLAVDLARRAGELAFTIGDHVDAARHYESALDAIDLVDRPDEGLRLELTIRLGEALALPDLGRGLDVLRNAARLARRAGDAEAFADAVCSMPSWGGSVTPGAEDPLFVALAEEALELLPESATIWRARVMALLGVHLHLGYHPDDGLVLLRQALDLATASGDDLTRIRTALSTRYALGPLDRAERLANAEEAYEAALVGGHDSLAELCAASASMTLRSMGRFDEATAWHRRAMEASTVISAGTVVSDACFALAAGDLDEAQRRVERLLDGFLPAEFIPLYYGGFFLTLEAVRGRAHEDLVPPSDGLRSFVGVAKESYLALVDVLQDDLAAAQARLDEARASGFDRIVRMLTGATGLARYAEVADACGDADAAQELLGVLEPLAGQVAEDGPTIWCSIDYARALLLLTTGDAAGAATVSEGAVAASRERGTRIFLARELLVLARARRDLGAPAADLRPLVAEALMIAEDTGASLVVRDLERFDLAAVDAPGPLDAGPGATAND